LDICESTRAVTNGTSQRSMPKILGDDPYNGHANDGQRKHHLTRRSTADAKLGERLFCQTAPASAPGGSRRHGWTEPRWENCVGGAFFPGIESSWQIRTTHFTPSADQTSLT